MEENQGYPMHCSALTEITAIEIIEI